MLTVLLALLTGILRRYGASLWQVSLALRLHDHALLHRLHGGRHQRRRRWVLLCLLTPQIFYGGGGRELSPGQSRLEPETDLYAAITADAGAGFDPQTDLVAWPDLVASGGRRGQRSQAPSAAMTGRCSVRSTGAIHNKTAIDPGTGWTAPTPYWLICGRLRNPALRYSTASGHTMTLLGTRLNVDNGEFGAYRVD